MKTKIMNMLLCATLLITSLAFVPANAIAARQTPSVIRLGLREPVDQLDPLAIDNFAEALIVDQIFLGLTGVDENGNPIPELAKSWEVSDDGLTWTFHLRGDVQWIDPTGNPVQPVTANDVAYSVGRAVQAGNFGKVIQDLKVADDFTIAFYLAAPLPNLATLLAVSPAAKVIHGGFNSIIGTVMLQSFTPLFDGPYLPDTSNLTSIQLKPNPYWANERGLTPYPVQINMIPDPKEALAQYLRGDLDMIEMDPAFRNIVVQEQALAAQVHDAKGTPMSLYGMPAIEELLGVDRSYLVKPYLLPVYSPILDFGGLHLWQISNTAPDVDVPGTTRVLNDDTLRALKPIPDDQAVLTFDHMTPQLSTIFINDIVVGDTTLTVGSDAAPYGFLRRVTNLYLNAAGEFVIETAPAALEQAVARGGLSASIQPDLSNIFRDVSPRASAGPRGGGIVRVDYVPPSAGLNISFDEPIHDLDGDLGTTNDQVRASGSVNVAPGAALELGFSIQDHQLQSFHYANIQQETSHIELYSNVDVVDLKKDKDVKKFIFTPATIFVGPVPVVLTPELAVNVGAFGSVSVGASTGIDQSATILTGFDYQSDGWAPTFHIGDNHIGPVKTELKESAKAGVYAGPKLSLMIYGVAGPYGKSTLHLTLKGGPSDTPLWTLTSGIDGELGARMEILSLIVTSYSQSFSILDEQVLAQADQVVPTPTDIPPVSTTASTPASTYTPPPQPRPGNQCGSIWWPPGCWNMWIKVGAVILLILIIVRLLAG